MNDLRQRVKMEAQRLEEDCTYSAKGHFNAAGRWGTMHLWLGVPAAVLSAVAGVSALSQFPFHDLLAGILALGVAAVTGVTTFLNPNERACSHQTAGNKYNSTKARARNLSEVQVHSQATDDDLLQRLDDLTNQRDELSDSSPLIPQFAYLAARRGIEEGEAGHRVDKPISK